MFSLKRMINLTNKFNCLEVVFIYFSILLTEKILFTVQNKMLIFCAFCAFVILTKIFWSLTSYLVQITVYKY